MTESLQDELLREPDTDFLANRIEGLESMRREIELQIDTRVRESERRILEIQEQIVLYEVQRQFIFIGDPTTRNSTDARLFSTLNNLYREMRGERIQCLKDTSALRLRVRELQIEINSRRDLLIA